MTKQNIISVLGASAQHIMALMILIWVIYQVAHRADEAAYAYPTAVIQYGLIGAKTDDDVIALVERWKRDEWGAQIGALRVLCERSSERIEAIGDPILAAKICRIVK